jgi:predicted ATP-dependent serine protease
MPRSATITVTNPYTPFGTFAGLTFWPGGLTLVGAMPGIGKTSWLIRMVREAAQGGVQAALGNYEHTEEELQYRANLQAEAVVGGPHGEVDPGKVAQEAARSSEMVLLALNQDVTIRALEQKLIKDNQFPAYGPALIAVDYLSLIPVLGVGRMLIDVNERTGAATEELREMAKRHKWAVIAAAALDEEGHFLGDERVVYRADRTLKIYRKEQAARECGCIRLTVKVEKDRTAHIRQYELDFWGARFYPALPDEFRLHD